MNLKKRVKWLQLRLGDALSSIASLNGRINNLTGLVQQLQERINRLAGAMNDALREKTLSIESRLTGLEATYLHRYTGAPSDLCHYCGTGRLHSNTDHDREVAHYQGKRYNDVLESELPRSLLERIERMEQSIIRTDPEYFVDPRES